MVLWVDTERAQRGCEVSWAQRERGGVGRAGVVEQRGPSCDWQPPGKG